MAGVTASVVRELAFTRGENDQIRAVIATVTLPASYTNGATHGDAVVVSGMSYKLGMVPLGDTGGYMLRWDKTNQLLKAYWVDTTTDGAPCAEVANATNLSGVTVDMLVIGV